MASQGILEGLISNLQEQVRASEGEVKPEYVVDYITALQDHEYDAHITIMGQNGNGKSMLLLEFMKRIDPTAIHLGNILYASDTVPMFIRMLKEKEKTIIGIDELKKFFHYREHSTTEQITLTNMIEYARSHRLAVIGCCNDIRRINSNYRNAKVQMVIWLLDRYDDNEIGKSYGLVFVGNPALEEDDKFRLNAFQNVYTFEQIRLIAESLPTFLGYIFVDDIAKTVSKEEIALYVKKKEEGIRKEAERMEKKLDRKEASKDKMSLADYKIMIREQAEEIYEAIKSRNRPEDLELAITNHLKNNKYAPPIVSELRKIRAEIKRGDR